MLILNLPERDLSGDCRINGKPAEFKVELNPGRRVPLPTNDVMVVDRGPANVDRGIGSIHFRYKDGAGRWEVRRILAVNEVGNGLLCYSCES